MVEQTPVLGKKQPRPKYIDPRDIQHRFGAKSDFIRYFKE